jgi:Predicted pPIWI-associating nuclease
MPNDAFVQSVRCRLPDDAHVQMFDDALAALGGGNRRRAQHFAVTLRELFGHVLSSRAPDDEVRRCIWFKQEQGTRGPTRRQRALYLSRGGLSDDFIRDTLKLDPDEFHRELRDAFDELSKNTHVRPNAASTEPGNIEEFADRVIGSFDEVFDIVDEVRYAIEQAIEPGLQDEAASVFIREMIDNLDIIANRYNTEGVLFDETNVLDIGPEFIRYRVVGTVNVQLHYGSKSDPAEIDETFPFTCTITAKVSEPFNFLSDMTEMEIDTSSWHGDSADEGEFERKAIEGDGDDGASPGNLPQ